MVRFHIKIKTIGHWTGRDRLEHATASLPSSEFVTNSPSLPSLPSSCSSCGRI